MCEPAQAKHTETFHKSHFVEISTKNAGPQSRDIAQSKRTWTFHKSHFVEIYTKNEGRQFRGQHFVRDCASKRTWGFHKSHFVWKFKRKMPNANSAASILREPAQSKRTWTFHKSHFVWKFKRKMPNANSAASCVEIYRKNAARAGYHLDQTPGRNCYRKNPFSVATLFGELKHSSSSTMVAVHKFTSSTNQNQDTSVIQAQVMSFLARK